MYNNLVLYRNELKNKNVANYKIIGMVVELILSKEIFKKNKEIGEFIEHVFNIKLKDYILKSRTVIVSKVCKGIADNKDMDYKDKLNQFINEEIEIIKKKNNIKDKKNEFDGWVKRV